MSLQIKQKKEWAQQLYCEGKLTQKSIAEKVEVSERTMVKWVEEGNWDRLRKSLLISKQEILSSLYDMLHELKERIREREQGSRYPDSKEADQIMKLTASIENIEEETNLADVMEVGKRFIQFVQQVDWEKAKEIVDLYDGFIRECLKSA